MKPRDIILAERGQIVIPKEARDALGLKPGCKLQISLDGRRLVVEKKGGFGPELLDRHGRGRWAEPRRSLERAARSPRALARWPLQAMSWE